MIVILFAKGLHRPWNEAFIQLHWWRQRAKWRYSSWKKRWWRTYVFWMLSRRPV